jgi:deoxycytidylate deaminase
MSAVRTAYLCAAGLVASAVVLRRILRIRVEASKACQCSCALHGRGLATPSKRRGLRTAEPELSEDHTPAKLGRLYSDPLAVTKRTSNLSWEEYFMSVAFLSAQRSKDPNRQVGACVVNGDCKIVGIGYNGFPWGCGDDELPWAKTGETPLDTKYPYVCHAELNAIMNANSKTLKVRARNASAGALSADRAAHARLHPIAAGLHLVRDALPVQRVRQADHPGADRARGLLLGHVPRHLVDARSQAHVSACRHRGRTLRVGTRRDQVGL